MLLKIFPWQLINLISPGPSNFQRIFSIKVPWVHDALQIKHACYNLPILERDNYLILRESWMGKLLNKEYHKCILPLLTWIVSPTINLISGTHSYVRWESTHLWYSRSIQYFLEESYVFWKVYIACATVDMCTTVRRIIVNKYVMRIIMDCKLAYHITSN